MTLAIAAVVVVLAAVAVALVARSMRARATPPLAPAAPEAEAKVLAQPGLGTGALDAPTAPALELKMVSCTVGNGVHGAMPPFGRLRAIDTGLVFEASSRVMAATNAGFDSGDSASTMQSLGSVEMGQYRFDVVRAEVQALSAAGPRVTMRTGSETYTFEGIGPTARQLQPWLKDHGYDV